MDEQDCQWVRDQDIIATLSGDTRQTQKPRTQELGAKGEADPPPLTNKKTNASTMNKLLLGF